MSILDLAGIGKNYGRKVVFADVTATISEGLTLLTGRSGAGKSTLLRLLATAERPSRGRLSWDGRLLPAARRDLRAALGYAPQAVDLPDDLSGREFARYIAALKGLDLAAAERQFGAITDAIGLHADINQRIATYSGGMRRRLVFAQALLGTPRLVILDEPTAELDSDTAAKVSALIAAQAKTAAVVMTTPLSDRLDEHGSATWHVADGVVVTP